ncbi:MAG TPA: hypothetical protein VFY16_03710 [Gemmatimonadaceae bacterium]|nr:hypothetical protein [Gemmatimonadaceae bacterium]
MDRPPLRLPLDRALLVSAALLAACAGDTRAPAPGDTATAISTAVAPAAESAPAPADTSCPMFGAWRECSVVKRLESAGLAPERLAGAAVQPAMSVAGTAYRLGGAEIQIFLFADSAIATRDASRFQPGSAAQPVSDVTYTLPPVVLTSGNLTAVVFARTERQLERVQLALTAGLPASESR